MYFQGQSVKITDYYDVQQIKYPQNYASYPNWPIQSSEVTLKHKYKLFYLS